MFCDYNILFSMIKQTNKSPMRTSPNMTYTSPQMDKTALDAISAFVVIIVISEMQPWPPQLLNFR